MKQFQYVGCTGVQHGPFTIEDMDTRFPLSVRGVSKLIGGEHYTDLDGDTWSIVPDLELEFRAQHAERLERIATAVLTSLAASDRRHSAWADYAASAVAGAKALIAELDKQS